ncbi:Serine carboxypeptidase-like 19 [Glycine soja]
MGNTSDFVHFGVLLPFLLLSQLFFQLAWCGSIVKFLPGLEGPLPFVLETGYVGVGESEDVQAFYYFIESENNPKEDPLMLWLTGGPGCSAFSGLVIEIGNTNSVSKFYFCSILMYVPSDKSRDLEILLYLHVAGPIAFKNEEYNGSLPNLVLRPHSWTKVSSIIFVDLPVSTGFTYATTEFATQRSDWIQVHQVHQFLRKWLIEHPNFLSTDVYIGGDSYSGITIPAIVQEISLGNEKGLQPWINLQGYLLGNPATTRRHENYRISFAHGMGLISDELYRSLQKNCKGEYINVDTKNVLCSRNIETFNEVTSGLSMVNILDPSCDWLDTETSWRRSLLKKYPRKNFLNTHLKLPSLNCRSYAYFLCGYWANDDSVRSALHIRKGTIGKWRRCTFNIPNKEDISSSYEYHVNLSRKGYRSLIYSGDHDMKIPFLETQAWISSLNYSIVDDWRQWHTDGQVAGYTRTYSNRMTFATVKGGGHTAPEYKPEECLAMFRRWISNKAFHRIILTHEHADAVLGLDDIRAVQAFSPTNDIDPTPIYLSQHSMDSIAEKFPYLVQKKRKEGAEIRRVAQIDWNIIADDCNQQFFASGLKFTPLPVMHGEDYICLGFLFGEKNRVAYISDVSRFPASTEYVISKSGAGQLDLLILDSLYRTGSHNVHLCFPQTLETVKRLCPKQTLLIGMTHEFDHHKDNEFLMEWSRREGIPVKLAHDGLRVKACDNVYRILLILIRLDWSINILYRISSISAVVKSHIFARGRISGYEKRITYFDGNPNSSY